MRKRLFLFCLGILVCVASALPPFLEYGGYQLYWQPFGTFLFLGVLSGATLVVIAMIGLVVESYRSRRYLRHVVLVLSAAFIGLIVFGAVVGGLALAFFVDRPLDAKPVSGRLYRLTAKNELDDMGGVRYVLQECVALGFWCHSVRSDSYWVGRPPPARAWLEVASDGNGVVVKYEDNPNVESAP